MFGNLACDCFRCKQLHSRESLSTQKKLVREKRPFSTKVVPGKKIAVELLRKYRTTLRKKVVWAYA